MLTNIQMAGVWGDKAFVFRIDDNAILEKNFEESD
jgi:hypothetical protein